MDTGAEHPADGSDESSEKPENWYFNLPSGAWERQEEKNRELRERVHSNLEEEPARQDPFAAKKEDPKDEHRGGLFGPGRKKDEPAEHTTAGGTFRLAKPGNENPVDAVPAQDSENDWSSEPILPLRPRRPEAPPVPPPASTGDDGGEGLDDGDILSNMRKWATAPGAPAAHVPAAGPDAGEPAVPAPPHALPLRLHRPEPSQPPEADDSPSRWKEVFSSGPAEVEGLAAMREWVEKGPVLPAREEPPAEIPEEFLKPFEWETEEGAAALAQPIPPDLLKPFEWEAEAQAGFAAASPDEPGAPPLAVDGEGQPEAAVLESEPVAAVADDAVSLAPATDEEARESARPEAFLPPAQPVEPVKQGGLFGRMFGRNKKSASAPASDEDIRVVARPGAADETAEMSAAMHRATPEEAGWLPAESGDEPVQAEADIEEPANPWKWPTETRAPASEASTDWRLTTGVGLDALLPAEVEEAPLFETLPEPVMEEPVAAEPETPWTWSAPEAEVSEEAPPFETAPETVVEEPVAAEPETPWTWSAPEAEMESPADEAAEWEPEPVPDVFQPTPTLGPSVVAGVESDGWDPEPFEMPAPPSFQAPADALTLDEALVEPDEFTFSFEPEATDEPATVSPAGPASDWVAPVQLAPAPLENDEERAWWETEAEEIAEVATTAPVEPVNALGQWDAGVDSIAPGGPEAQSFVAEDSGTPEVLAPAPVLQPRVDEDPWGVVSTADAEDVTPQPASAALPAEAVVEPEEDPWSSLVSERDAEADAAPAPASPVASWSSMFTPERPAPAFEEAGEALQPSRTGDETPDSADPWGSLANEYEREVVPLAALDDELDLASSLESQMAEAERAPLWDRSAYQEPEPPVAEAHAGFGAAAYEDDEDDVVLRAFNEHAATPEPEWTNEPRNDEAFGELLGAGAAEIVAEAAAVDDEPQSFVTMRQWAPDRRQHPENPFDAPWEAEEDEVPLYRAPNVDMRPAGAGEDGPPWANDLGFGNDGANVALPSRHNRAKTLVREVVETVMLALLVFLCVRASFQNFKVDGSSMYPTLEDGQFLIVNKLVYSEVDMEKLSNYVPLVDPGTEPKRNVFHGPQRGDIVVLQDPRKPDVDLIKRVIGLPGETVEIVNGKVYVNDFLLEEPYIKNVWHDNKPKVLVPPGEYFVMGDNRDNSLDSRSQQVGFVPEDLIIGKAMLSYWPRNKFGLAPNGVGSISEQDGVPRLTAQTVESAR